ncbi:MAG: S8 family serine peptidase, partial [Phycisphaerae bacterium]|nr:S8 family serine peptidase [Phycisphaerae bacterium]
MFKKTVYLSIIFFAAILTSVKAADLPYKEGELLIRFAPRIDGIQRTTDERNQILASFNAGTVKASFKLLPSLSVVKLPVNLTVVDALPKLRGKSEILYVEPNYKIRLASTLPNDTRFDELWGMHNTVQTGGTEDADIDAPEAWDIITDSNAIVAVIDTGVDYSHPDLAGNIWVNEIELNGDPNVDDDNNGYKDDIYGYDFGGYDVSDQDNDPMDEYGHGTHVAGTVGAVGNNSEGITGVCWSARIMALKIFPPNLISEWEAFVSNAVEAIEYAVDNDAKVINASWTISNNYSQALKDAIEDAGDANIIFVAAASNYSNSPWYDNDVTPDYPSSYDCNNIISVMSTDHDDYRSSFSHYGATTVDLGAPGSNILSCVPGGGYESWNGTSMAAPHVAGACALVWGMNPALGHLEVKDIILDTVDLTDPPLVCVSQGRLNLYNAIVEAGIQAGKQAVILNKVDDVNGPVLPGDHITYTISFENTVRGPNDANFPFDDLTNVKIVDHLPKEVYCNNPIDPNYNSNDHTYTWNIGTLQEDDSDSLELTVVVNNLAEPLGKFTNVCVIEANEIWPKTAIEITDVNCWNPGIIYVDMDAAAIDNTGMSWEHAYTDLQEAIYRARKCGCEQIWVAKGTYKPAKAARSISFELVDGVAIYGGFAGIESHPSQRNLTDPNNETILSG